MPLASYIVGKLYSILPLRRFIIGGYLLRAILTGNTGESAYLPTRTGVVVFDGTPPEKAGPKQEPNFEGPGKSLRHQIIKYFLHAYHLHDHL